jgi:hypothetical protein
MLVSMFTVVGVALLAWLWLKASPRWAAVLPAAGVMIGGAVMILVPDIVQGAGEPGSLTTGRAWLGFAASVGAMLGNTLFIVLAQVGRCCALGGVRERVPPRRGRGVMRCPMRLAQQAGQPLCQGRGVARCPLRLAQQAGQPLGRAAPAWCRGQGAGLG